MLMNIKFSHTKTHSDIPNKIFVNATKFNELNMSLSHPPFREKERQCVSFERWIFIYIFNFHFASAGFIFSFDKLLDEQVHTSAVSCNHSMPLKCITSIESVWTLSHSYFYELKHLVCQKCVAFWKSPSDYCCIRTTALVSDAPLQRLSGIHYFTDDNEI